MMTITEKLIALKTGEVLELTEEEINTLKEMYPWWIDVRGEDGKCRVIGTK